MPVLWRNDQAVVRQADARQANPYEIAKRLDSESGPDWAVWYGEASHAFTALNGAICDRPLWLIDRDPEKIRTLMHEWDVWAAAR